QHQRGNIPPVQIVQIFNMHTRNLCFGNFFLVIVESIDIGTALFEGSRGQKAGIPEAEDRDFLTGEGRDGDQDDTVAILAFANAMNVISTSASPGRQVPAPRQRSKSESRFETRSSQVVRSGDGSAPS